MGAPFAAPPGFPTWFLVLTHTSNPTWVLTTLTPTTLPGCPLQTCTDHPTWTVSSSLPWHPHIECSLYPRSSTLHGYSLSAQTSPHMGICSQLVLAPRLGARSQLILEPYMGTLITRINPHFPYGCSLLISESEDSTTNQSRSSHNQ